MHVKKQAFLLCLVAVSLFFFSQVSLAFAPPAPDPNEVQYFDSNEIYWRPHTYVDIRYADDLYWYAIDTDLDNQILVNETVTLFNLTSISSLTGVTTFTSSGLDAQYNFTWSPTDPYTQSVQGEVTSFDVSEFSDDELTLTVNAGSGATTTTRIYCASEGEPMMVTGASSYNYDSGTRILTLNVVHSSPQEILIDWASTPQESALILFLRANYYLVFIMLGVVPIIWGATLIIGLAKGRDTITMNDMFALISIMVSIALAYIVIITVMNSLIGG